MYSPLSEQNWSDYGIDKAFYVNLDRRSDRRAFFENQTSNFPFRINRYPARDGNDLYLPEYLQPYSGAIGCKISHIEIYRIALEAGYSRIVVFEDDCLMKGNEERFQQFLESIPDNWSWFNVFKPNDEFPNVVYDHGSHFSSNAVNSTHCYGIDARFMRKVIEQHDENPFPNSRLIHIDMLINDIGTREGIRCFSPKKLINQNTDIPNDNHWGWPNQRPIIRKLDEGYEWNLLVVAKCSSHARMKELNAIDEFDFEVGSMGSSSDMIHQYSHVLYINNAWAPIRRLTNRFFHAARMYDCGIYTPASSCDVDWYPTAESLSGYYWIQNSPRFISDSVVGFKSELADLRLSDVNLGEVLGKKALELKMPIVADSKLSF